MSCHQKKRCVASLVPKSGLAFRRIPYRPIVDCQIVFIARSRKWRIWDCANCRLAPCRWSEVLLSDWKDYLTTPFTNGPDDGFKTTLPKVKTRPPAKHVCPSCVENCQCDPFLHLRLLTRRMADLMGLLNRQTRTTRFWTQYRRVLLLLRPHCC